MLCNCLILGVFHTKLQVWSGHWLHPLWFCASLLAALTPCQCAVFAWSPFGLYFQQEKALCRHSRSSICREDIGDRGIMIILGSPCDWHSGETEVRLITLTSLLYQPRKHSEVPSHPNRERTQPVLPMFPDSCLAFLPSTWQLIVFPQDSAGQSCLRFHLANKHAGIYYFHWLQSNGNSTLPTNPKKLDFVIIER